eukprot:4811301-Pyramimonas_sp.AAC.1
MTEKLGDALDHFSRWFDGLKHICRLVSRRWSKDRLLESCFSNPCFDQHRRQLEDFSVEVYEGRWGSILVALSTLLPLQRILRMGWSLTKFGNATREPGEKNLRIDVADQAIRNHWWWAYA